MTDKNERDDFQRESFGIFSKVTDFFTSVRTTIGLLFLLAAASVVGTLVPQTESHVHASTTFERLAVILDLHNVYRSWWFISLLILLALNLLGCLVARLPLILQEWNGTSPRGSIHYSLESKDDPDFLVDMLIKNGQAIFNRDPELSKTSGNIRILWMKDRLYLLGFPFLHSAIITILIGGLIGMLYGYRGHIVLKEGETGSTFQLFNGQTRKLPFEIAADKLSLTFYPTGEPKDYRSDVRLLENGKVSAQGAIRVNHPLTYNGISLYQSDFPQTGVIADVTCTKGGETSHIAIDSNRPAPELGGRKLRLTDVYGGLTAKGRGIELTVSGDRKGPKVLEVFEKGDPAVLGEYNLKLTGLTATYATGLQIGYDPGTPVVWTGCAFLVLGFIAILFTNYRRLSLSLITEYGKTKVVILGSSRKMRAEFRESVETNIIKLLKKPKVGK